MLYLDGSSYWEAASLSLPTRVKKGGMLETIFIDETKSSFMTSSVEHSDDKQSLQVFFVFTLLDSEK